MEFEQRLVIYAQHQLGGRAVPVDLRLLLQMQWNRDPLSDAPIDPLAVLGIVLFDEGQTSDLIDHSYLNTSDRSNPDIMANVVAIDTVNTYIVYVAQDDEHNIYGYWLSPEGYTLDEAPIVRYDSEGQYSLLAGQNLTEALLGAVAEGDEALFLQIRTLLETYGVFIPATSEDELVWREYQTDPSTLHKTLYYENRRQAGL